MNKIILILFLLSILALNNCKPVHVFQFEGKITGSDPAMCACCGGWFITIGQDRYRFDNLPNNSSIDLNKENLPIYVRLNWKKDPNQCMGDEIVVLEIEKK